MSYSREMISSHAARARDEACPKTKEVNDSNRRACTSSWSGSAYRVLLLAGVFAVVSCAAPTPTPTPCTHFESFDAVSTYESSEGTGTREARYSDRGYHVVESESQSGEVVFRRELIVVDGTAYMRHATSGDPESWTEWRMAGTDLEHGSPLPCGVRAEADYGLPFPADADGPHMVVTQGDWRRELWVDAWGRPTHGKATLAGSEGELHITYSGHGEPNPISAPIATPTPRPTATPRPFPQVTVPYSATPHAPLSVEDYARACGSRAFIDPLLEWDDTPTTAADMIARLEDLQGTLHATVPPAELRDFHHAFAIITYIFLVTLHDSESEESIFEPHEVLGMLTDTVKLLPQAIDALSPDLQRVLEDSGCFG